MVYYVKIQKYVIWRNHMILACQNISKAFGTTEIIKNASFHIEEREKAALVGINGAGKSTLLKIIIGEMRADEGEVILSKGKTMGYLAQHQDLTGHLSIYQEVLTAKQNLIDMEERLRQMESDMKTKSGAALDELLSTYTRLSHTFELENGYAYRSEVVGVLKGLGFSESDFEKQVDSLSGGQKTRVALGKLLLTKPDIILLDEPTNDLDLETVMWLENYLANFEHTVLVVSHDRHFLNTVCTHIVDIDYGKIKQYVGNYDFWYESSQLIQQLIRNKNKRNEEKIAELQTFIARFAANKSKSKQATSRRRLLDKLSVEEMPASSRRYPFVGFEREREVGKDILFVTDVSKTVDGVKLLDKVSFIVNKNDKIAFVGENELAQTTMFKILMGELEPDEGSVKWGQTVTTSYLPKDNSEYFDGHDESLVDWIRQFSAKKDDVYLRGFLGRMLFSGDEVFKAVKVLSGGEKVRCMLSRMMLSGANVLMLDQPTNHLDLESITAVNNGLIDFKGVVLFASHDHEFVQTIANRVMEFVDGKLIDKMCTYDAYIAGAREEMLARLNG